MSFLELLLVAVGLSMDAFAVSICQGLCSVKVPLRHSLLLGIYFGGFQAGMPLIGYFLGSQFSSKIQSIDHWIAFILLGVIGFNMIRESRSEAECPGASYTVKALLPLAIATSIDALAVGVSFAFLNVAIIPAVACIGITTFLFSAFGVQIGSAFGSKLKSKAELTGGIVLILIGSKILLEHLELLPF